MDSGGKVQPHGASCRLLPSFPWPHADSFVTPFQSLLLPQSQYESAKKQLNAYEDIATKHWVGFSVVKVLAGHHLSDETANTAVREGFKVLRRKGTEFNPIGF